MKGQKLAVIAALPREIGGLVRGHPADAGLRAQGIHLYRLEGAIAVAGGMGAARAALAVDAALAAGPIEELVSTGLAGSCSPQVVPGSVTEASMVIDARTGERFSIAQAGSGVVLATTLGIANVHEKKRLAATYNASMVDMEAAVVARLAQAHGLRFRAIKGISDAHDFELASLARFEGKHGSFRTAAFALHTAFRPQLWQQAARLGRESNRALAALQIRLQQLIDELA